MTWSWESKEPQPPRCNPRPQEQQKEVLFLGLLKWSRLAAAKYSEPAIHSLQIPKCYSPLLLGFFLFFGFLDLNNKEVEPIENSHDIFPPKKNPDSVCVVVGFLSPFFCIIQVTPPKTNMEPKHGALEDDFPFQRGWIFMFQPWVFGGGSFRLLGVPFLHGTHRYPEASAKRKVMESSIPSPTRWTKPGGLETRKLKPFEVLKSDNIEPEVLMAVWFRWISVSFRGARILRFMLIFGGLKPLKSCPKRVDKAQKRFFAWRNLWL